MELKGLKANFLGDSITEGVGASSVDKVWWKVLEKDTGIIARGYGVGGTRIARQQTASANEKWDHDFNERMLGMDKDADIIGIFGGTNDYGHGDAKIGDENDDSPYTFNGGLNNLMKRLIGTYGKDKICFILPIRRFLEEDLFGQGHRKEPTLNLKGYVDIIRSKCEKEGVDYIDLYNDGIPKPLTDKGDEYTADGLHPNDKGHLFIAEKIKEYLERE